MGRLRDPLFGFSFRKNQACHPGGHSNNMHRSIVAQLSRIFLLPVIFPFSVVPVRCSITATRLSETYQFDMKNGVYKCHSASKVTSRVFPVDITSQCTFIPSVALRFLQSSMQWLVTESATYANSHFPYLSAVARLMLPMFCLQSVPTTHSFPKMCAHAK